MTSANPAPGRLDRATLTIAGRSAEVLRQMVLDGALAPGQRINEVELAAALGVSRGPLREAIQRLASEGLLTTVSHRGAYVRTFDETELRELYELRIAVESHAVRLAADRVTAADVAGLQALLDQTHEILTSGTAVAYPRDHDFHVRVVALAGNRRLLDASVEINQQIQLARSRSARQPLRARDAYDEHAAVVSSLSDRDGERAAALLTEHLRASLDSALQLLDSAEDTPGGPGAAVTGERAG